MRGTYEASIPSESQRHDFPEHAHLYAFAVPGSDVSILNTFALSRYYEESIANKIGMNLKYWGTPLRESWVTLTRSRIWMEINRRSEKTNKTNAEDHPIRYVPRATHINGSGLLEFAWYVRKFALWGTIFTAILYLHSIYLRNVR